MVSEYAWQQPTRGIERRDDRAVLLAHGAGSDMHGAVLVAVADALAGAGVASLRFNYPYRSAAKKVPDRPEVLETATRAAAAELVRRAKLPLERLVLGGRSMGGRYCSMAVGAAVDAIPALGLLLLGYPLHAAGKPDRPRVEHLPRIGVPVLLVSGTRDALAGRDELTLAAQRITGPTAFHWLDTADHGYRPLARSGRTRAEVAAEVGAVATDWVLRLPG